MNVAPTQRRQLGNASVHVLRVRVVGSKAYLDYAFVRAGTVLATIKGDVYVRVRGTWLDELDGYTNC